VSEEFGERSKGIIDAYGRDYPHATPFDLYAAIAAASFRRPACEQASRKAALNKAPAYSYIYAWRTPVLDGRPATLAEIYLGTPSNDTVRQIVRSVQRSRGPGTKADRGIAATSSSKQSEGSPFGMNLPGGRLRESLQAYPVTVGSRATRQ